MTTTASVASGIMERMGREIGQTALTGDCEMQKIIGSQVEDHGVFVLPKPLADIMEDAHEKDATVRVRVSINCDTWTIESVDTEIT